MAAVVAQHPFGAAGGAAGVQNVERVRGGHGHGRNGDRSEQFLVVEVAPCLQVPRHKRALENHHLGRFVACLGDGFVHQRLVGHDAVNLNSPGGAHNYFGQGIVDAHGQLVRRKPAKHHGMHRPNAGASQHRHHCFGQVGHVDDNPVAQLHAKLPQAARETGR